MYKEVCATCHSMDGIRYGQLVNTILLEEEAKADAAENDVFYFFLLFSHSFPKEPQIFSLFFNVSTSFDSNTLLSFSFPILSFFSFFLTFCFPLVPR